MRKVHPLRQSRHRRLLQEPRVPTDGHRHGNLGRPGEGDRGGAPPILCMIEGFAAAIWGWRWQGDHQWLPGSSNVMAAETKPRSGSGWNLRCVPRARAYFGGRLSA